MSGSLWIRTPAGRRENVGAAIVAGGLAAGVGIVTFYFTRMLMAREPIPPLEAGKHPAVETVGEEDGGA